jgi:hypothetical protein
MWLGGDVDGVGRSRMWLGGDRGVVGNGAGEG